MRCAPCGQLIRPGMETTKRVEIRRASKRPDSSVKVFGENMPDGALKDATGTLVEIRHQKCHWVVAKRARRPAVSDLIDPYSDEDDD